MILTVFTLICAIGGQWTLLQSVAWVGMAVRYAQDGPLSEALQKTFDGRHPCSLCKVVQEGKKSEQKQTLLKVETKIDFWLARSPSLLNAPASPLVLIPSEPGSAPGRTEPPATPPPRLA